MNRTDEWDGAARSPEDSSQPAQLSCSQVASCAHWPLELLGLGVSPDFVLFERECGWCLASASDAGL